jgi:ATP-dependent Clp protease ATP-binding subunit ClpA
VHDVRLEWDDAAIDALLAAGGWDEALGARPMRRTIQRLVEDPLAALALEGRLAKGGSVRLGADLRLR